MQVNLTAADLAPGLRFVCRGVSVEVLRVRESRLDRFGRTLDAWWCRSADGAEGYVYLGPGGFLAVESVNH